jgi:hypothetical protein
VRLVYALAALHNFIHDAEKLDTVTGGPDASEFYRWSAENGREREMEEQIVTGPTGSVEDEQQDMYSFRDALAEKMWQDFNA